MAEVISRRVLHCLADKLSERQCVDVITELGYKVEVTSLVSPSEVPGVRKYEAAVEIRSEAPEGFDRTIVAVSSMHPWGALVEAVKELAVLLEGEGADG